MKEQIDDITHHTLHYLILCLILFGGLGLAVAFSSRQVRFLFVLVTAGFYVIWAIGHHFLTHKHVPYTIVIEYILVACLGIVLAKGILGL